MKKLVKAGLAASLKPLGFRYISGNCLRRKLDEIIHVVKIHFYMSERDSVRYNSSQHAFSIEFGIQYECVPYRYRPIKNRNPDTTECELRRPVRKILTQPNFSNSLVWSANNDLSDLPDLIADAVTATQIALPWFDHLSDLNTAYKVICRSPEDLDGTWGQGNLGSPIRNYFAAFMAKRLGRNDDAEICFRILKKRNEKLDLHFDIPRLDAEFLKPVDDPSE